MNPLTEQRALIALDLLLGRGISMTRATKLARTTPKTLKSYFAKESNGLSKTADLKLFAHLNRKDLK